MGILYNLVLTVYWSGVKLASLFSHKAKNRAIGSANWKAKIATIPAHKKRLWFHVSSYGEFEQGLPVFKSLREKYPDHFILLTFFSPSGFEPFKNFQGADLVLYLPFDFPSNANYFVRQLKPEIALFVKYEFWFNYLRALSKQGVPVVYFSAVFRSDQYFFKKYGAYFLKLLKTIRLIFVQDQGSADLLVEKGITQVQVIGDTRFDRVLEVKLEAKVFPEIEQFCEERKVLVIGSSWMADEQLTQNWYLKYGRTHFKLIIAPHEISEERIKEIMKLFPDAKQLSKGNFLDAEVLLIDRIGILKHLYQFGDINFVGGGFGKGIHNTLEPAVWGKPVVFGPNYHQFNEAKKLIESRLAFSVESSTSLNNAIDYFEKNLPDLAANFKSFFDDNKGASIKVVNACATVLK